MTESQDKIFELLGTVIGGVSVFIACVLVFLVVYANRFLVKRRKREFGIYLMLGMSTGRRRQDRRGRVAHHPARRRLRSA